MVGCAAVPPPGAVRRGVVRRVFVRSFHIALTDGAFLTLGGAGLPPHPASVLWPGFPGGLEIGREMTINAEGVSTKGRLYAAFAGMDVFTPSGGCSPMARAEWIVHAIEASLGEALGVPARGGFHDLLPRRLEAALPRPPDPLTDRLARAGTDWCSALARTLSLRDWGAFARQAPAGAGMGIGLTPAGDDFLAGVLAALRYHGRSRGSEIVPQAFLEDLARSAGERTTTFSAFLLRCAARGLVAKPFSSWLSAVHRGDAQTAARQVREIAGIGHSSGMDTLSGMLLALQILMGERPWIDR